MTSIDSSIGARLLATALAGIGLLGYSSTAHADCTPPQVVAEYDQPTDGLSNNDQFGHAVAMYAETAVVGAWNDDISPTAIGSVRVFVRSGNTWLPQGAKLTASDSAVNLGSDVDVDTDTLVASAFGSRAAYVFTRSGGTWTEQAKLENDGLTGNSNFSQSAAISGDTIVVGDNFDSSPLDSAGAAYVFVREGAMWTQQAKLIADDATIILLMGHAVDVDGDTAVAATFSGTAVYVFVRNGTTWSQQAKLEAFGGMGFGPGTSVAIDGDRVMIGAPSDNTPGGAVFFFTRTGTSWAQVQKLPAAAAGVMADSGFGNSVDLLGDLAIVGAYQDGATDTGSAHILVRNPVGWSAMAELTESTDVDANDEFGYAVALYGDAAVVGAQWDDWGTTLENSGAATFYDIRCEGACCVNGACVLISISDCGQVGGEFQGLNSVCTGVACDPPCCRGDFNGDQTLNALDVQGFTDALLLGETCP